MIIFKREFILEEEKDLFLSLFRIPITFFGTNANSTPPKSSPESKGTGSSPSPKSSDTKTPNKGNKFSKATQGLKAAANVAQDPEGAVADVAQEATKKLAIKAGKAAANAVGGPLAGKVVEAAAKSKIGQAVLNKVAKCIPIVGFIGVLMALIINFTVIILPFAAVAELFKWLFDWGGPDEDNDGMPIFSEILQEEITTSNGSLLTILDDCLEEADYNPNALDDMSEEAEDYVPDEDGTSSSTEQKNSSTTIFSTLVDRYSPSYLKAPSKATGYDNTHNFLFDKLLNNLDYLKNDVFNNDNKINNFLDSIKTDLDKSYNVYNPDSISNESVTLRTLFNELSTDNNAMYSVSMVSSILKHEDNDKIISAFNKLQEKIAKVEVMTYMQACRSYDNALDEFKETDHTNQPDYDDVLPHYTDENIDKFFAQYSSLTDISSYLALAFTSDIPELIYEIAILSHETYSDDSYSIDVDACIPIPPSSEDEEEFKYGYVSTIETWSGFFYFDGVEESLSVVRRNDPYGFAYSDKFNYLLNNYELDTLEKRKDFFKFLKSITGNDPMLGTDSTYAGNPLYVYSKEDFSIPHTHCSFPINTNDYKVTARFEELYNPNGEWELHHGLDIARKSLDQTPPDILAVKKGVVESIFYDDDGYGHGIKIKHADGMLSIYGHGDCDANGNCNGNCNGTFYVEEGDEVGPGQPIMKMGTSGNSTGIHLHLAIQDPTTGTFTNPETYIGLLPS